MSFKSEIRSYGLGRFESCRGLWTRLRSHTQHRTRRVAQDELSRVGQFWISPGAKRSRDRHEIGFGAPGIFDNFFTHTAVQPAKFSKLIGRACFRKESLQSSAPTVRGLYVTFVENRKCFQICPRFVRYRRGDGQDVL